MSEFDPSTQPPKEQHSLRSLLAAKKGNTTYQNGEAFLLHVFWVAPSLSKAEVLLKGLQQCARATHRDTPCVPTYFFRLCQVNQESGSTTLAPPIPRLVKDHPHLVGGLRKRQMGIPPHAIRAELLKRGFDDPAIMEWSLDAELPVTLQEQPVALEFTEIYLDEQAFMEHAGSRDYLDGYGIVMNPSLHYTVPSTIRLGTPSANLIEKILEPVLKEQVVSLPSDGRCHVWKPLSEDSQTTYQGSALMCSLDCDAGSSVEGFLNDLDSTLTPTVFAQFRDACTTFVVIPHPYFDNHLRVFFILPLSNISQETSALSLVINVLEEMKPVRGEIFIQQRQDDTEGENTVNSYETVWKNHLLHSSTLSHLHLTTIDRSNGGKSSSGYLLHEKAGIIQFK